MKTMMVLLALVGGAVHAQEMLTYQDGTAQFAGTVLLGGLLPTNGTVSVTPVSYALFEHRLIHTEH